MFRAGFVKVALLISLVFVSTIQAEENPLIRAGGELIGELGVSGAPGGRMKIVRLKVWRLFRTT